MKTAVYQKLSCKKALWVIRMVQFLKLNHSGKRECYKEKEPLPRIFLLSATVKSSPQFTE